MFQYHSESNLQIGLDELYKIIQRQNTEKADAILVRSAAMHDMEFDRKT